MATREMVATAPAEEVKESLFGVSWSKTMMWLFIVSDALTFAGFLAGYGMLRMSNAAWPVAAEIFDMRLITFMTFALISSSAMMAMAVGAAKENDHRAAVRFLMLTILGGLIFLSCQAYEWTHLIGQGARLFTNPWGVPLFSACFFVITGFHGLHVTVGVIILSTVARGVTRERFTGNGVEVAGLYWHFVDVVWVFIFAFFYLL